MKFSGGFTITGGVTIEPPPIIAYTLYSWGANDSGQLGLGNTASVSSPTQVGATTDWITGTAGIAIKKNSTLWTWSNNFYGQLGLGDRVNRSSPTQVGTGTDWAKVFAARPDQLGSVQGAIKKNGTLWMWGDNGLLTLGLNDFVSRSSPTQVGTDTNWDQLAMSYFQSLAIKTNGTLWAWGSNANGGLGLNDGNPEANKSNPTQIGTDTNWSYVSAGSGFNFAIKTDGTLWAWGSGANGRLGLNNAVYRSSPTQVGTATNWSKISAGNYMALAVKTDGTLWSWGYNYSGELGLGNTVHRSSPTQIGTDTNWSLVNTGKYTSFAIKTTGTLWGWGNGQGGSLGLNTSGVVYRSSPTQIGARTDWYAISMGSNTYSSFGFTTT